MINTIEELCEVDKCCVNDLDWGRISIGQKLSEPFIEKFQEKVDWLNISGNQKLSEQFIEKFQDKVDWAYISKYQKLSEQFIEKFQNKVHWNLISKSQKLSEQFIEKFQHMVGWDYISINQKLSEDFIEEFQDIVNWYYISKYQKLSEDFIEKFQDKVIWDYISKYQKLSEEFRVSRNIKIHESNWLYKTIELKRNYVINNTDYKLEGDFVIAYKSCRQDGYSKFNFQYLYEEGKTYECHADFNSAEENSFGLSAWTKGGALKYCDEKLFKVKIHLNDIACFVHNNNKIRAQKITIIELM